MSYKGYSFNLHREDDKEIIDWLSNKKVTRTIKIALYNQMKSESNGTTDNGSIELLSVIKKAIENNGNVGGEQSTISKKSDIVAKRNDDKQSLSGEDAEDFEKIFDI